jgi:hypothetical protein
VSIEDFILTTESLLTDVGEQLKENAKKMVDLPLETRKGMVGLAGIFSFLSDKEPLRKDKEDLFLSAMYVGWLLRKSQEKK